MIHRVVARKSSPAPAPAAVSAVGPGKWTLDQAYGYCERVVREHTENFPVASRFVPAHLRPHVWALYAFARQADDFADEPRYAGRRHEALADWEDQLEGAYHGRASHPVFVALRDTVDRRDIPISPLRDLLDALRMDLTTARHPTFSSLSQYMARSSHPIGRLVLYTFDYRDADLHRYSDDLCTALQMTNFLQDVGRDLARGHVYLPEEDLSHFGVAERDLTLGRVTPEFRDLMRYEVARTRAIYERGRPIGDKVGRDLGFELNLIWHGGTTILDKIEEVDYDVFRRRPELTAGDKIKMVARSAARRWPTFRRGPGQPSPGAGA